MGEGAIKTAIATAWDAGARLGPRTPGLTVLYYHAVKAHLKDAFAAQMDYLQQHTNIVSADCSQKLDPFRPNVAVTFDDAFRSVREQALPILLKRQIPFTVFVPTGWVGRAPAWKRQGKWDADEVVMTFPELAELPRNLVTLGSHSLDHVHLSRLPDEAVLVQLVRSREMLEENVGHAVRLLSLPYGDFDARVIELAASSGYRHVFTDQPRGVRQGDEAVMRGRTATEPTDDLWTFSLKARGAFAWMPAAVRAKAVLRGEFRALSPTWRWQERFR